MLAGEGATRDTRQIVVGPEALLAHTAELQNGLSQAIKHGSPLNRSFRFEGDITFSIHDPKTGHDLFKRTFPQLTLSSDLKHVGGEGTVALIGPGDKAIWVFCSGMDAGVSEGPFEVGVRSSGDTASLVMGFTNSNDGSYLEVRVELAQPKPAPAQELASAAIIDVPRELFHGDTLSGSINDDRYRVGVVVVKNILADETKYLLVQEAKSSCAGRWYLPAGGIKIGESFVAGARRELMEEGGLDLSPAGVVRVERYSLGENLNWSRVTFLSTIDASDSPPKTVPDKDSLQSQWFSLKEIRAMATAGLLRAEDIMPLIEAVAAECPIYPLSALDSL